MSNGGNETDDKEDSSSESEMEHDSNDSESENTDIKPTEIESVKNVVSNDILHDDSSSEDETDDEESEKESEHETSSDEELEKEISPKTSADQQDEEKSGWADAMAKVLNMGKNLEKTEPNKPLFLSKAIKDSEIKHRTSTNTIENNGDNEQNTSEVKVQIKASIRRAQKKEMEEKGRSKPDIAKDRAKEKMLCKLATKGVVQLFNAVREQQKTIKTQLNTAGGSVRKREKVFKNMDRQTFLNVLSNQSISKGDNTSTINNTPPNLSVDSQLSKKPKLQMSHNLIKPEAVNKEEIKDESIHLDDSGENESTWNVLRDDFMMGSKMKDWDKEDSDSEG